MVSTVTTLSLLPSSLNFHHSSTSAASSSSSFLNGGTHLRSHKNFASVSLTVDSSTFGAPKFNNARDSARRFGRTMVSASGDYYATLGIPKSASSKEIKAAYRKLARQVSNWIGLLYIYIYIFWYLLIFFGGLFGY